MRMAASKATVSSRVWRMERHQASFYVALELSSEGAVVPGGVDAAVDFAALEEEATSFGEGEEFIHCDGLGFGSHVHSCG